ncbi:MAG: gamma-glutamyltransferase family protein [Pseudomonadota bacterium]
MIHPRRFAPALLLVLLGPQLAHARPALRTVDAPAVYAAGMVSAADPRAAQAGAEMLRAGGNATDAALATMFALSVVEPQSSGIGGGGFLVRGTASGQVDTFDGRETAPAAAGPDWWLSEGRPLSFADAQPGGKSVGVPGAVALAGAAHLRFGKLPWARVLRPAILLARNGFEVTPRLHRALTVSSRTGAFDPRGRTLFYTPAGPPLAVGTRVRNPALARFLTHLARRGPDAFYTGFNQTALVRAVNSAPHNPGAITAADVAGYAIQPREPLCGEYRTWRICGMGPPSSGATTVFAILKQVERFDLGSLGPESAAAWHILAESMLLAYADRDRFLADPGYVSVPAAGLMDPAYLAARSALIDPARSLSLVTAGSPPGAQALSRAAQPAGDEHGTSHFVAMDRRGDVVSFTNTIEGPFGSGVMVNGYYLNNELTDFDFVPSREGRPAANAAAGGKRPRSSMAPTLVYDPRGRLRLAIGAAGGATIPAQVAKSIVGVIDWNLPAQAAIALPVLFAPGDSVFVEAGSTLEAMIPALRALGHADVRPREMPLKANAIEIVGGTVVGAADPRSEGAAIAQ